MDKGGNRGIGESILNGPLVCIQVSLFHNLSCAVYFQSTKHLSSICPFPFPRVIRYTVLLPQNWTPDAYFLYLADGSLKIPRPLHIRPLNLLVSFSKTC